MTEKIKPILRYLAFLLTLTVLMFSLSLNVVKAADRNQTADGSQTTDGTRPAAGNKATDGDKAADGTRPADGNKTADRNQTADGECASPDAAYANFRNVRAGKIGKNNLFRSQHPANGTVRSLYANELAEENGILTVLNLSDSDAKLNKFFKDYMVSPSYYYKTLYARGRVYTANLRVTRRGPSYCPKVAAALRFFVKNKGPYLVHCEVGRDRSGLVILLLECLMGAPYEYMVNDYARSYINIDSCSAEKAKKKAISHVNEDLIYISGQKNITDWSKVDLARCAGTYLKTGGMTVNEISALKKNLAVSYPDRGVKIESLCTE